MYKQEGWGQRQPRTREQRPRPQRDHDGVARERHPIDLDTGDAAVALGNAGDPAEPQFGPCVCAAGIIAAVNSAGCTCAVVSGEPIGRTTVTASDIQPSSQAPRRRENPADPA
jgi:hypothetical protein